MRKITATDHAIPRPSDEASAADARCGKAGRRPTAASLWKPLAAITRRAPGLEFYSYFQVRGAEHPGRTLEAYDGKFQMGHYAMNDRGEFVVCVGREEIKSAAKLQLLLGQYGAPMLEGVVRLLETVQAAQDHKV